jgi:hypothetical protein
MGELRAARELVRSGGNPEIARRIPARSVEPVDPNQIDGTDQREDQRQQAAQHNGRQSEEEVLDVPGTNAEKHQQGGECDEKESDITGTIDTIPLLTSCAPVKGKIIVGRKLMIRWESLRPAGIGGPGIPQDGVLLI